MSEERVAAHKEYEELGYGRLMIPEGKKLVRLKDMRQWERDALPKGVQLYAKPGCRHCLGKGSLTGQTRMVGMQVTCRCVMVQVAIERPAEHPAGEKADGRIGE